MTAAPSYATVAQAYVQGVRDFFTPPETPPGIRGTVQSTADLLAVRAETLLPRSGALTAVTTGQLADADPGIRAEASTHLLAKALTDLEVSQRLFEAADAEDELAPSHGVHGVRAAAGSPDIEEALAILLRSPDAASGAAVRGGELPESLPIAKLDLTTAIEDALDHIRERAGKIGELALGGLVGLGLNEVAKAAGMVGMSVAGMFGQAERVTRLYNLALQFLSNAYDSLLGLLGEPLAKLMGARIIAWLGKLDQGKLLNNLLDEAYETDTTRATLGGVVAVSRAELDAFGTAIARVKALDGEYRQQLSLVEKLLTAMTWVGGVTASVLPHGGLLMAVGYILLGGYAIAAGGDYVDAPRFQLLDRAPGVRRVVEASLGQ